MKGGAYPFVNCEVILSLACYNHTEEIKVKPCQKHYAWITRGVSSPRDILSSLEPDDDEDFESFDRPSILSW